MLVGLFATALCLSASAEELYPFAGRVNVQTQSLSLSIGLPKKQTLIEVSKQLDQSYSIDVKFENPQDLFFEKTAHLKGVVHIENDDLNSRKLTGRLWSEAAEPGMASDLSMTFELTNEVLRVSQLNSENFQGTGQISLYPPYDLNVQGALQEVDIVPFLGLIIGTHKEIDGLAKVSGNLSVVGSPVKLMVKASVVSEEGMIGKFSYDVMSLHVQGVYPSLEVANSTITTNNGFSFDLDGSLDLSHKETLPAQLKGIKRNPLVKENALQSQWVLKRVTDNQGEGNTETKFFLKKDKKPSLSEQDDAGLIGMEKKIGF